jgi:hypothetical protein
MVPHEKPQFISLHDAKLENFLPADNVAYMFPNSEGHPDHEILRHAAIEMAGPNNLDLALLYGSHATGTADRQSIFDMILIVDDVREFHRQNLKDRPDDYGRPHNPGWHAKLNRYGFNYYNTKFSTEVNDENGIYQNTIRAKYAVISRQDFIRGCNGVFGEKNGAFAMYVDGRMHKVGLTPLFIGHNRDHISQISTAINTARNTGILLALSLMPNKPFTLDKLLETYTSLSYYADLRIDKWDKGKRIYRKNIREYQDMADPILSNFSRLGFIEYVDHNKLRKVKALHATDVWAILILLKFSTATENYLKNPATVGIGKGIVYALSKIYRSLEIEATFVQLKEFGRKIIVMNDKKTHSIYPPEE